MMTMTLDSIIAFTLAMAIFSAAPGPGFFALVGCAATRGRAPAFALLIGILLGDMVYVAAAIFGLSFLANSMESFFFIVRLAGAGYLIYLGWQSWRTAGKPIVAETEDFSGAKTSLKAFVTGFAVTVSNPKVVLFYLALLPTFVDLTRITALDIAVIVSIITGMTLMIEGFYILAAAKMATKMQNPKISKVFNRLMGGVLMSAGTAIAVKS